LTGISVRMRPESLRGGAIPLDFTVFNVNAVRWENANGQFGLGVSDGRGGYARVDGHSRRKVPVRVALTTDSFTGFVLFEGLTKDKKVVGPTDGTAGGHTRVEGIQGSKFRWRISLPTITVFNGGHSFAGMTPPSTLVCG